jgi:hypothetical protein
MGAVVRTGIVALALAVSAACSGKGGNVDSTSASRAVTITMERTPCFGRCPVYRVSLNDSGTVVYEGRGFVRENGRHETTVRGGDVQALAKEIEDAGWFSLRDNYPPDVTDHASVITTVTIDGRTKRVEHNLGSRTAPATLEVLYARIDDVAGTKQWVGEGATPRAGEKGGGPDTARRDTAVR